MVNAYKLFTLRRDGTIGPLFIDKRTRVPIGQWIKAKSVRTPGFKFRPGWHACAKPDAPHLSSRGRIWAEVSLKDIKEHRRPEAQGGLWYTAKWIRVERLIEEGEE